VLVPSLFFFDFVLASLVFYFVVLCPFAAKSSREAVQIHIVDAIRTVTNMGRERVVHNTDVSPILEKLGSYGVNNLHIRGEEVAKLVKNYNGLLDLIPNTNTTAIQDPLSDGISPLTHARLRKFVESEFNLEEFGLKTGTRVSILLPNGPELAVAVISILSRWCAAPINPTATAHEIKSELMSTGAKAIMVLAGAAANEAALHAADELGVGVLVINPTGSVTGLFRVSVLRPVKAESSIQTGYTIAETVDGFTHYGHPETVLLLHTSGTSGNKKLVPYSLDMIIIGVGCIISSWNLTATDVCLNMMPLFHIGGIMRNILSPILSGGSVIACSGFDPLLFWDILYKGTRVTWYYAAPTMHHALLMEAGRRPSPLPVQDIRFIANAAGGLLPVLAEGLRDTFHATVLTGYGMTECMPISSPPQSYKLDPVGTSGIAVGPDIIIVDDSMVTPVPVGEKGNILLRGPPCFGGYENNGSANSESFFTVNGVAGWFNTGDMGSLDAAGYLYISGRSKEIINRGGETISPFEIEEAVLQHPHVKEVLAFSAPHAEYQESVGVCIVTAKDLPRVDLLGLHKFLDEHKLLHRSKWPQLIVYMEALPKNAAGKLLRIKLAERLALADVDEEAPQHTRLLEGTCPPVGAPLTQAIAVAAVDIDVAQSEHVLRQHQRAAAAAAQRVVKDVVVVSVDLPFRNDAFVAFVVLAGGGAELPRSDAEVEGIRADLLDACTKSLHAYLVPTAVYVVPSVPRVAAGGEPTGGEAVDSGALRTLAIRLFTESVIVLPRNQIER
jgi:acyl-CoA synthetase (AMP-forming)/AMP-acid ligase II